MYNEFLFVEMLTKFLTCLLALWLYCTSPLSLPKTLMPKMIFMPTLAERQQYFKKFLLQYFESLELLTIIYTPLIMSRENILSSCRQIVIFYLFSASHNLRSLLRVILNCIKNSRNIQIPFIRKTRGWLCESARREK